ncbi:CRISPR-associated helicase/endonuclease Cas3 [candidate division TA06 bacterium B3_TA06]|uniref:CRISPR-associated helicase/endonuclease Cas3 n=1 Tax=candidate division TA06 bacterium B3_TA06 TaxID=2012487 RepID=A0A532V195_UNCT6|nr:MAG: CRISPR-associated helicase/endonuclease Cas3 [candidate division TA06 bacterium B3_TA06]
MTNSIKFIAHTHSKNGRTDTVRDHLQSVAKRASEYAKAFSAADEARLAGLLHDLGKYGSLFQKRLEGKERGIDHWSVGAWQALKEYREKGVALALTIQGHHVGLQQASKDSLSNLDLKVLNNKHPLNLRLSEPNHENLIDRMNRDGLILPPPTDIPTSLFEWDSGLYTSAMLDVRMLFSTLVDADFIETEAHFNSVDDKNKGYRKPGPPLEADRALEILLNHLDELSSNSKASPNVNQLRKDLLEACLDSALHPQGLFTLTSPTGSGKTLSMLAFALKHAVEHELRRVVVVIPYLSIIEQTVSVYRNLFQGDFGEEYVLEHHSLAGTRGEDAIEDYQESRQRLLSQNWDAPIVVTTSVQFLESLFANRPSACRKLHRLAKSVILFDEVQTLPTGIAVPTLATLSRLIERYNASVVFSTATQPAFEHLNYSVKQYCAGGWEPKEIVPSNLNLFQLARRTNVLWPDLNHRTSWEELAENLKTNERVLCVVNLKRHALDLFDKLKGQGCNEDDLFHLSTNMCPEHRKEVLGEVRNRLEKSKPCRLTSTQCIEAGVDVDFPLVYRAWGPLDSIAQAAGRCNREGKSDIGMVHVFIPEDDVYPNGTYRQAAGIARILKAQDQMDIHDPELFHKYYRELYDLTQPQNQKQELIDAIKRQDFVETAKFYRVIAKDAINVLVPYSLKIFQELKEQVRQEGLTRRWIKRARPYTIGLFRPKRDDPVFDWLEPISVGENKEQEEWFIYLNDKHYNPKTGLVPPESMECLIG